MTQEDKYQQFCALHAQSGAFVIPNPWNAGSAMILESLGYGSLATTSAGLAFSMGRCDSQAEISRDEALKNASEIVEATCLPVSADLENGFGDTPEACAETIRLAAGVGLVGGSIEDATGRVDAPIYEFDAAVERVSAAADTARDLPFLLTARCENFLHGCHDLDDTIARLLAFEAVGADVLYAPGLPGLDAIRQVCSAVNRPVNVVMGLSGPNYSVAQLADAGVRRISVGGSFARAALGGFIRAAHEVREHGTFGYAVEALPDADARRYMAGNRTSG